MKVSDKLTLSIYHVRIGDISSEAMGHLKGTSAWEALLSGNAKVVTVVHIKYQPAITCNLQWATGRALCMKEDNFCKKTGIKIAMQRAMRDLPKEVTKEERTLLWYKAFGGKPPGKRKVKQAQTG